MASRGFGQGFGRSRGSPAQSAAIAARDGAVAAFLDLDTRQRVVTDAMSALRALEPGARLLDRWKPVEETCFTATAEYVSVSTQYELEDSAGRPLPVDTFGATTAYQRVHKTLADAASAVDDFYNRHRTELDHAVAAVAATPRIAEDAVREALTARAALDAQPAVARFRSVQAVAAKLAAETDNLDRALAAGSTTGVRDAATAIHAVAGEIQSVLSAAQTAGTRAGTAISSVKTRIEAVNSHIDKVPPARSALLREFSEPNSIDLVGNVDLARAELVKGQQLWRDATAALAAGNSEAALDLLATARDHLTTATTACDQVTDRLTALRAARADPSAAEKQVRFRIRDAQRLVVDRGLTAEWGSVLDAQARRVDVAKSKLTGPHPNFWAYLSELQSVTEFVRGVVDRIRKQAEAASHGRSRP
jgi:hypothetical protein